MGFNRVADRRFDAANPRTADRELPRGAVSLAGAVAITVGAASLFVAAAALLGRWPLLLSPVALVILLGYSLGQALHLGHAPVARRVPRRRARRRLDRRHQRLRLGAAGAVARRSPAGSPASTSSTPRQDVDFDRARGLGSIPARFGVARALVVSRAAARRLPSLGLIAFGVLLHLGVVYGVGVAVIAATLAYEQRIVSPTDLSRVNKAFFDLNGYVSLAFAVCAIVEALR